MYILARVGGNVRFSRPIITQRPALFKRFSYSRVLSPRRYQSRLDCEFVLKIRQWFENASFTFPIKTRPTTSHNILLPPQEWGYMDRKGVVFFYIYINYCFNIIITKKKNRFVLFDGFDVGAYNVYTYTHNL